MPWPGTRGYSWRPIAWAVCKARASNQSCFATDQGSRHFMSANGPLQRRTDDACNDVRPKSQSARRSGPSDDLVGGVDQRFYGGDGLVEHLLFLGIELDLDDTLDALFADHHRHADIEALHAVLAIQHGGAGDHALLVLEIGLGHGDGRRRRRIEGRAGLEQADDLGAAVAGALHDLVQPLAGRPTHVDQVVQGDAANRRVAQQRHHGVAVAAQHEGGDVVDRDVELLGEEQAEARAIEHARHADDALGRKAGDLLHQSDHGIERIGDDDDEGVRRVLPDALADGVDDPGIDADQVVAAHAWLARHARRDDDDVGTLDVLVVGGAAVLGVEAYDGAELGDVEGLALGDALGVGNVEQDDVAQFLLAGQQRERTANLSGADQRDLLASHAKNSRS